VCNVKLNPDGSLAHLKAPVAKGYSQVILHGHDNIEMNMTRGHVTNS